MNYGEITKLLAGWSAGSEEFLAEVINRVHGELRLIAAGQLRREGVSQTLSPTELVQEAFLRLARVKQPQFKDRRHFYALAALLMRHVLVEQARKRAADKRSGMTIEMAPELAGKSPNVVDVLALDQALTRLGERDPRQVLVVELRFFGGFSVKEVANILGCSTRSVESDWTMAKTWLYAQLRRVKS